MFKIDFLWPKKRKKKKPTWSWLRMLSKEFSLEFIIKSSERIESVEQKSAVVRFVEFRSSSPLVGSGDVELVWSRSTADSVDSFSCLQLLDSSLIVNSFIKHIWRFWPGTKQKKQLASSLQFWKVSFLENYLINAVWTNCAFDSSPLWNRLIFHSRQGWCRDFRRCSGWESTRTRTMTRPWPTFV